MYKRILIATDGSPLSDKAVESGLSLAALTGASVVALKVVPRYPRSYFEGGLPVDASDVKRIEGQWGDAAQAMVDAVKAQGAAQGVTVKAVVRQVRPGRRGRDFCRQKAQVRPDRDGLARPQGPQAPAAGQRNPACADALAHPGAGAALKA